MLRKSDGWDGVPSLAAVFGYGPSTRFTSARASSQAVLLPSASAARARTTACRIASTFSGVNDLHGDLSASSPKDYRRARGRRTSLSLVAAAFTVRALTALGEDQQAESASGQTCGRTLGRSETKPHRPPPWLDRTLINEGRYCYVVELAVPDAGLEIELNNRIVGFHKLDRSRLPLPTRPNNSGEALSIAANIAKLPLIAAPAHPQ